VVIRQHLPRSGRLPRQKKAGSVPTSCSKERRGGETGTIRAEDVVVGAWPANSNSEPDVMGDALEEIQELASHTVELLAPPKR